MKLYDQTWKAVEKYLQNRDLLLIPIGSTEQHGPTGLIGTDFLTAQAIAEAVGEKEKVMVASPLCYGMARHHMAFAGSATISPTTFILVIKDLIDSFSRHGFKKFIFINGHGGNIAPLTTAFSEIKDHDCNYLLEIINWWHLPEVKKYEDQHFGDANGFHATCGEVAVTMHLRPEAFSKIEKQNFSIDKPKFTMPLGPSEFREIFPDGRMFSNPGLATATHGKEIMLRAIEAIGERVQKLF